MGLGDGAMGLGCSMVGGRGEISENVSCAPRNGGRKGANLLVGLNREIIQTGWRIGDPLRFLLSQLAPLCILLRLRRLHLSRRRTASPFASEEGSRLETNVIPNRYTLSSSRRVRSLPSHPLQTPTEKNSFSAAVDRWERQWWY